MKRILLIIIIISLLGGCAKYPVKDIMSSINASNKNTSTKRDSDKFQFANLSVKHDEHWIHIYGEIKNVDNKDYKTVTLKAYFCDEDGKTLGDATASLENLTVGETKTLDFIGFYKNIQGYKTYKIEVDNILTE